jgi:hypothetical protein
VKDLASYHQQKREQRLANMRAAFRLREEAELVAKAERTIRRQAQTEQAERRRAAERAEARRQRLLNLRDPEHKLYGIAVANNLGGREFTEAEIRALEPCGRFEQLQGSIGRTFSLDVKRAVALGATLSDLTWVAGRLTSINAEADRRYRLWSADCQGRGQAYKLQRFIEIFSMEELPDEC